MSVVAESLDRIMLPKEPISVGMVVVIMPTTITAIAAASTPNAIFSKICPTSMLNLSLRLYGTGSSDRNIDQIDPHSEF